MMSRAMAPYVDLFVCETMSCPAEAASALQGLQHSCPDAKAWVAYSVNSEGVCRDGTPFNVAIKELVGKSVSGIGVNCCMPEAVDLAMASVENDAEASSFAAGLERVVYANAYPKDHSEGIQFDTENFDDESTRLDLNAERYAAHALKWASRPSLPFTTIGGCCGILPSHIQLVSDTLKLAQVEQGFDSHSSGEFPHEASTATL